MNGHTSDFGIHELDRSAVQLVVQDDRFYQPYIQSLALLQDLLCEFTDSLEKPRFTPTEIEEQEGRLISIFATALMSMPLSETVVRNIEENYFLAKEIRNNAEHSKTLNERSQAELRATQFLNSVVQTYTTLRILRQYAEPVQTRPHSI